MGQRVLVVDDDVKLVRGMSRILTRQGYDVLTATDVEGALAHAEADRIDAANSGNVVTSSTRRPSYQTSRASFNPRMNACPSRTAMPSSLALQTGGDCPTSIGRDPACRSGRE